MKYIIKNKDIELPSVTTILGILDKSPALMGWATKCMQEYFIENYTFDKDANELIKEARFNYRQVSEKAMDIGSKIHDLIEQYIKHGRDAVGNLQPEVENGFIAFLDWEKQNVKEWIASELQIYNEEIGYAGTLDAVFVGNDDKIYVVDFKSSMAIYDEYYMQLSAYFYAYNQKGFINPENVKNYKQADYFGILRLDKETGLPEWVCQTDKFNQMQFRNFEIFKRAAELYYWLKDRRLKNNEIADNIKANIKAVI